MERFRVEVIAKTLNPQQVVYAALHQDYTENFVFDDRDSWPSEEKCGEVIVNRLLAGDRGHYGCYDDATEVLTQTGWKQWSDVISSDALAAVEISTNSIHFEKPEKLQKYWHDGFMYHVHGQAVDLLVTLDHRMVVSHRHKNGTWTEYYFSEAKTVLGKPRRYLVAGNFLENSRVKFNNPWEIDPVDFAKLLGFFISDGSAEKLGDQIRFHLKKQRKIDYLNSLGLNVEAKKSDKYVVNLPGAGAWFKEKCYKDNQKCLPQEFLLVTKDEIEGILDGLINGDGNIREHGGIRFASTSVTLLDQIQALLCINGYTSGWSINHQESELHSQGIYLSIHNRLHPRVETSQEGRSRTYSESIKDYSGYVYCASVSTGALMVRRNKKPVVCGNCLEHPQIVFNCGYFPHSVMQQARTHRVGVSFDVQSFRYTGVQVIDVVTGKKDIEDVFYLRPVGYYSDRQGKKYYYSPEQREADLQWCLEAAKRYQLDIAAGMAEEHARGKLPFDYRQHFVVSFNLRSVLHFCDLRNKKNAQLEIQKLCELMWPHIKEWTPAVAEWYENNRLGKARLAP